MELTALHFFPDWLLRGRGRILAFHKIRGM